MEVARAPADACVRVCVCVSGLLRSGVDRPSANRPSTLEKTLRNREDGSAIRKAESRINSFAPLIDLGEDCRVK